MDWIEPTAYAAGGGATGASLFPILMIVGLIAMFYFLVWRPQSKQRKAHQELVTNLSRGDEVVTAGGLMGVVTKVEDDYVRVQIANKMEVRFQKGAITQSMPKGSFKSLDE